MSRPCLSLLLYCTRFPFSLYLTLTFYLTYGKCHVVTEEQNPDCILQYIHAYSIVIYIN